MSTLFWSTQEAKKISYFTDKRKVKKRRETVQSKKIWMQKYSTKMMQSSNSYQIKAKHKYR